MATPAVVAAAPTSATLPASSTHTPTFASRASAARRSSFRRPTTWLLTSTSVTPACTSACASLTFWQHTPTAPWAICRRAITAHLWVLACGRSRTPAAEVPCAIVSRLRSKASRSTSNAGVSTSASRMPISAGGGFIAHVPQLLALGTPGPRFRGSSGTKGAPSHHGQSRRLGMFFLPRRVCAGRGETVNEGTHASVSTLVVPRACRH